MKCGRCGSSVSEDEMVSHGGMEVCEDCAMTLLSPAKACDPWAVKMAKGSLKSTADAAAELRGLELKLYSLVKKEGRIASEQAPERLGVSAEEFKRAMSVLRHMELLRGDRRADGGADLVLF